MKYTTASLAVLLLWSLGCSVFDPPRYGAACDADADCGTGYFCRAGHCLPDALGTGLDAGPTDLDHDDLGAADGGADAGSVDADTVVDAAGSDAATTDDAAIGDSAVLDATAPDAAAADAAAPDTWQPDANPAHVTRVFAASPSANHYFGQAVAAGAGEVLVGTWGGNVDGKGEVWRFTRVQPGQWTPGQPLTRPPVLSTAAGFGSSLALSGDRLAIGAPAYSSERGRVHIYGRAGGTWQRQDAVEASTAQPGDAFGERLALSADGKVLLVGAPAEDVSTIVHVGAAYIYEDVVGSWIERQRLASPEIQDSVGFGTSVSVSDDGSRLIVGAVHEDIVGAVGAGAVYVYERSGDTWTQVDRVVPADQYAGWATGAAALISADQIIVGSPGSDGFQGVSNARDGEVTVFTHPDSSWQATQALYPSGAGDGRRFGGALALEGSTLAVGTSWDASPSSDNFYVHVHERVGASWSRRVSMQPTTIPVPDGYGKSVALAETGALLVVGAPFDGEQGDNSGSVYIFEF